MTISNAADTSPDRTRRRLAWGVPLVVAGVVAGGIAITSTSASGQSLSLTKRTPAQLIAAVESHRTTALTGVFHETANLGIPTLPGGHSSASLSWQTFVSGTHSAKVWIDGADRQRVALLGELSEADVVHNGNDVWTYTSETNTVTHTVLPKDSGTHGTHTRPGNPTTTTPADLTPAAAADKLLAAITPSTSVTLGKPRTVAGHAAYILTLRPKATGSTVSKVTIAVDAKRFVPLRVQVFGASSTPAFETGFTDITFARPSASVFAFTAPKGATTSTNPLTADRRHGDHARKTTGSPAGNIRARRAPLATTPTATGASARPSVIGTGWTSVLELPKGAQSALSGGMLRDLTTAVGSSGARLLHTALINALVLPDGRTFVGAVTPSVLEHVAATAPH